MKTKYVSLLLALAFLALGAMTFADALPPIPKDPVSSKLPVKIITVSGTTAVEAVPAEAAPAEAKSDEKAESVPEAPLPPCTRVHERLEHAKATVKERAEKRAKAKAEAKPAERKPCTCPCCSRDRILVDRPLENAITFLRTELLAKPVLDVRMAMHGVEGRCLDRQEARLQNKASVLIAQGKRLAERAEAVDEDNMSDRLLLLRAEASYARRANNLTVRKAALDLRQQRHTEEGKRLDTERAELYGDK